MKQVSKIKFVDRFGAISASGYGPPVIQIRISRALPESRLEAIDDQPPLIIWALIDTGADDFYLDEDLARLHNFRPAGSSRVESATHAVEGVIYPALISTVSDGTYSTHAADFHSVPLRKIGRQYDAILGMAFIRHGELVLNHHEGTYQFTFDPQT